METNTRSRLVSLNVGVPRPLDHRGRAVQSGIFKTPVKGKLWIDETRLEGDDQADKIGHGGPNRRMCVHPLENFPYWASRIGQPLEHGAFGENFTTEGLVEPEGRAADIRSKSGHFL